MRRIKLINALLWVANVAVAGAIVVFAFQYLIFPEPMPPVPGEEGPTSGRGRTMQAPTDFTPVRNLVNPVVPRTAGAAAAPTQTELERAAKFLGGYRIVEDEKSEVAFLQVTATNTFVNAYRGEPITLLGQAVAELRGWTLVRLTEDGALFTNGQKEVELKRDAGPTTATGPGGKAAPGTGQPFDPASSKSRKIASSEMTESWMIDPEEAKWATDNLEQLMQEVQLSAYSSGGIKIESTGSFAAQRGFMAGDVVKTVNGIAIRDPSDMGNLANSPQLKNAAALVVVLERAGRPFTLDFRPDRARR